MDTAHSGGELGRFWASVTGCSYVEPSTPDESGDVIGRVEGQVEGMGIAISLVPEPMTVKNRIHWDLYGDVDDLVARGATVLAELPGSKVLADPEGNEFSVFVPPPVVEEGEVRARLETTDEWFRDARFARSSTTGVRARFSTTGCQPLANRRGLT